MSVNAIAAWTYPAGSVDARGRPVRRRTVISALHTLGSGIDDLDPVGGARCERPHPHLGLVIKTAAARAAPRGRGQPLPAEYRLNLPPDGVQAHFPELGSVSPVAAAAAAVDPEAIWALALKQLAGDVSRSNYETWLEGTAGVRFAGGIFTVATRSEFVSGWLDKRLRPLIVRTLATLLPVNGDVEVLFEAADEEVEVAREA